MPYFLAKLNASSNHNHENKSVLDKLTQPLIDTWNTVSNKVDKVSGKGLSTNDYTTTEKNKLSGIASGAEVNVQSDWNITNSTSDAFIKNKPTSLPANGGNSTTVNGHTVESNVPVNAKFTDTNTTYNVVSKTANGLVPQLPNETTTTKYLRQDGSWQVPPDNNTVYTHPTTAGNKHIPTGGASGQILGYSASGTAKWINAPSGSNEIESSTEPTNQSVGGYWIKPY